MLSAWNCAERGERLHRRSGNNDGTENVSQQQEMMQYVLAQKQGCSPNTSPHSVSPQIIQITPDARLTEVQADPIHSGARLSERRDERQDRPAGKGMESGVCQADRRTGNAQSAVSCAERGSKRSRANPQERLQHLATGTAGAAAPQGAGYGAVTAGRREVTAALTTAFYMPFPLRPYNS